MGNLKETNKRWDGLEVGRRSNTGCVVPGWLLHLGIRVPEGKDLQTYEQETPASGPIVLLPSCEHFPT